MRSRLLRAQALRSLLRLRSPSRPAPSAQTPTRPRSRLALRCSSRHGRATTRRRWRRSGPRTGRLFSDEQTGAGPLRDSAFEVKGDSVRFVTPDVAVEDWDVVITGAYGPDGS